uniref:Rho guanyl-nucleotide exchange factor 12 n=1 Tax=Tanacetum cinerariifolium TaxID=118510 RepID=A0A6L2N581_TANCI|nr:Rho guanyl-nucleotide exchange factor 12 [Tanacetum cinerariifolium]
MPWVGLYVAGASLACTLAMAIDAFQGFRRWKLWFPNKFFVINTVSITLIAIAMKLPVDLPTNMSDINVGEWNGKIVSITFLVTMLYNFLPSLGLMNDKELLVNMVAWSILLITITVNVSIQIFAGMLPAVLLFLLLFPILWVFSIAFTVPASRRILEHRYKELHGLASYPEEIKFSYEELEHNVKKYWMMAETGNPQFAIACSEVASTFEFIGSLIFLSSLVQLFRFDYPTQYSDYNWSLKLIVRIQSSGACIGGIAPFFRCFAAINCFELSKKWIVNHLNIFNVEEHWTQMFQFWKTSHVRSHIPGRHCKIVFHISKNFILNICIALQIMIVVICKLICFLTRSLLILVFYCWYFYKLLTRFKKEENVSTSNVRSEMKEYAMYVLQIEDDAKLSEKVSRNALKSINQLLSKSEKNEPGNLIKLLKKSTGFKGVLEFDNDQVPPLHSEENKNSWSLVVVTLTAIVVALRNKADDHVARLIASMREGLQIVRNIEECLNADSDLVKTRRAARRVWTQVEVYRKWLQIDLQKKARDGKTSKEILEWLRDEAVKIVIEFKSCKKRRMDDSHYKFIVASSMYRVSATILIHLGELENWPIDGQLLEWISNMIADILCACFTNLPCVIKKMCHHDAIEKREDSVRSAAQLLDVDSMAYIGKWHALPKSEIPNGAPLNQSQLAFPSPNESVNVNIGL